MTLMTDTHPPLHILVVDDDEEIRELLGQHLQRAGYQVTTLPDGQDLIEHLSHGIGLVILDVMLPGEDGFSLCKRVREQSELPIIMLTAASDEPDRVIGLELGADDYIAKPFSPRELVARIKALMRRSKPGLMPTRRIHFGQWHLDLVSHQLTTDDGTQLALSGAEFTLLNLFLENPNKVLDRDMICNALHGRDSLPFDRSIDVQVSRLRQRLGNDGHDVSIIRTIRGRGYVLASDVTRSS